MTPQGLARELQDELRAWEQAGRRRALDPRPVGAADFSSNDYLGLARHADVIDAARRALREHGAGGRAARLLGGGGPLEEAVERDVAAWLGADQALLFPSGYHANLGLVGALVGPGDAVVCDRLAHASLVDAARLSRAHRFVHDHADLDHLEACLARARPARRRLVLTEGVFSMDGDVPPLREIEALCARHDAWLVVDEAHAVGVLGREGAGAWSEVAAEESAGRLAARVVTGGKALGVAGAFVVGGREVREICLHRARTFVFSTAPSPAVAGALAAAVRLCRGAEGARRHARELAARIARDLARPEPRAAIVPVVFGDDADATAAAARLAKHGLHVPAVRPPTVPPGTSRLRVVCHAHNTEAEVERLVSAVRSLCPPPPSPPRRGRARPLFVVGTDTDVGKTVVSALLVRAGMRQGGVRYWKPVQTGTTSDTAKVAALSGIAEALCARPAYELPLPASPHEAAAAAGARVDLATLRTRIGEERAAAAGALLVVELAGGLLVPLDERHTQADWLAMERPDLVLVARSGLGTLNHTLLTLEALRARHLEPRALFLVGAPHPSNAATLRGRAGVAALFELPWFEPLCAGTLDAWLARHDVAGVIAP